MNIKIERIYEDNTESGGYRFLIDRLWPRGISKANANLDDWLKDWAPSNELRKWFDHKPEKWVGFKKRYIRELKEREPEIKDYLAHLDKRKAVLLLYASKNKEHNHAKVLKEYIAQLRV